MTSQSGYLIFLLKKQLTLGMLDVEIQLNLCVNTSYVSCDIEITNSQEVLYSPGCDVNKVDQIIKQDGAWLMSLVLSELNITGRLPEAENLKPSC